jgi:hypothetical protein
MIELSEPLIRFKFEPNKYKQKMLIDILLNYSKLDLAALASTLEISSTILSNVHMGNAFLPENPAKYLAQLFIILFSD